MERQSEIVCSILDKLGVTDEVRAWFKDAADSLDELEFLQLELHGKFPSSLHKAKTVGSFSEGTFRTSYNSDRDILHPRQGVDVVEHINDASGKNYCVMEYLPLKPGYVRLKIPCDSSLLLDTHIAAKCVPSGENYMVHYTRKEGLLNIEENGPAKRNRRVFCELDDVYCLKCPWPNVATDWLQRPRSHGWPSDETIGLLQTLPCIVVQAGHPGSPDSEKLLEWKLSFTLQENHLMCKLSDIQFKCYVLLKMIKKDLIVKKFGESLTSYHCKTALFYTIEHNLVSIWRPGNLINCLILCLTQMKQWIDAGICPNYFLPDVNLFLGKIEKKLLPEIGQAFDRIIKHPVENLTTLISSNFGKMFRIANCLDSKQFVMHSISQNLNGPNSDQYAIENEKMKVLESEAKEEIIQTVHGIFIMLNFIVDSIVDYCLFEMEKISKMPDMNVPLAFWLVISKQTVFYDKLESMMAKLGLRHHVLPVLYASLASHLFDMARETKYLHLRDWLICASALNFMCSMDGDEKVVANLKLANVLFVSDHIGSAKRILDFVKVDIESRKIPLMTKEEAEDMPLHMRLLNALRRMADSGLDKIFTFPMYMLFTRFSFRPIVFLRSELGVTHRALVLEAFRSVGTLESSRFESNFWYDRASIDAVSFYTFLNFLVEGESGSFHSLFGQMDKIKFGNGVTYLNLLGWVAMEEEDIEMAASLFLESWKRNGREIQQIQKQNIRAPPTIFHHNAAKLHMLILIYKEWKSKQC